MRRWPILLLFVGSAVLAQEDDPFADDPFADDPFAEDWDEEYSAWPLSGFVELGWGRKLDSSTAFSSRQSLGDLRAKLETEWSGGESLLLAIDAEGLYDEYATQWDFDFRELSVRFSPTDSLDLKLGRQVLTWGTGDLLFLNDLFPKSWVSFFSGRDDEYLKAPADSIRATWYSGRVNIDAVWVPRFEPDDYLTGERFSFFLPSVGAIAAPQPPLGGLEPGSGFDRGELAVRLFSTVESTEVAGYLYRGYFKRPLGVDSMQRPVFPRLAVYGASLRRPLSSGIFNAEFAYHDSLADPDGTDPATPNSQMRFLVGYEFEAVTRLTVGLQWYLEWTEDHDALLDNSPAMQFEPEERRHVLTNRLTWRSARDGLTVSLFTFYSPSDDDHYLRPSFSYRASDAWNVTVGANVFNGKHDHSFFGQLAENSNIWLRVRYNY